MRAFGGKFHSFIIVRLILAMGLGSGIAACTQELALVDQPARFNFGLTDAPLDNVEKVMVNVKHAEIWMEKGGKQGRLVVAENLGLINLLDLRDGVILPLSGEVEVPSGVAAKRVRLVLEETGHHLVMSDDSQCELQTPSQEYTGIKIIFSKPIQFENNYEYNLVIDFDAEKSIVIQGNNGCLLKPVLKVKTSTRTPMDGFEDMLTQGDLTSEDDTNANDDAGGGFDETPEGELPEVIPEDDPSFYF